MRLNKHQNKKRNIKGHLSITSGLRYSVKLTILCSAVLIATAQPAYSYIDPGTGSMIWQLIVSAFIGMSFYFRKSISGILSKLKKGEIKQEINHGEK
jgi:hypothetical protein